MMINLFSNTVLCMKINNTTINNSNLLISAIDANIVSLHDSLLFVMWMNSIEKVEFKIDG